MTIPVTNISILRLLLQAEQNLSGLQRDMRANALTWKTAATAQSVPVATLATWMNDAAASYLTRLNWVSAMRADTTNWPKIAGMWTKLGGIDTDYSDVVTPLTNVANGLGPANKATYAKILTICDQIITTVNAPLSLWPE